MASRPGQTADSMTVDIDNLYREEVFSDMRSASVRVLTPVKSDGSPDDSRPRVFIGDTQLMTQMGPIPVQFELEAETIGEAFSQFPEGVRGAIERLNERAKEMAREEASRIVVPSKMPGGGGLPGGGLAGIPGTR
ncbi:MAG: hypothetical protein FJ164_02860 [Gammaproteobacteria bacterium]|nr:hypothetical protein [Gammaproteobacteria bacterium]